MPIYEFRCKRCGQKFEQRFSTTTVTEAACPHCGSTEVSRLMSLFFSPKVSHQKGAMGCEQCAATPSLSCRSGSCPICE